MVSKFLLCKTLYLSDDTHLFQTLLNPEAICLFVNKQQTMRHDGCIIWPAPGLNKDTANRHSSCGFLNPLTPIAHPDQLILFTLKKTHCGDFTVISMKKTWLPKWCNEHKCPLLFRETKRPFTETMSTEYYSENKINRQSCWQSTVLYHFGLPSDTVMQEERGVTLKLGWCDR